MTNGFSATLPGGDVVAILLLTIQLGASRTPNTNRRPLHMTSERASAQLATSVDVMGPCVALESTVISHGLPYPQNLETALRLEDIVRSEGATPATIGVIAGQIIVGLARPQ